MTGLTPGTCLYGLLGMAVGMLLNLASSRLLQRRARQQDAGLVPASPAPLPRLTAIVAGVGFAGLWAMYGPSLQMAIISAYFSIFLLIFVLDIAHRWVPNALILPTAGLVLIVSVVTGRPPLTSTLVGGAVGFAWFFLIAIAYRGALGAGDVKLAGLIGLMTGFPNVIMALTLGILVGGVAAALLLLSGKKARRSYIPYAPFLVTGALCTLLFGAQFLSGLSSMSGW